MENLFAGNIPILYIIAILYILLIEKLKLNQKIVIIYIFSYMIKVYNILDAKALLLSFNLVMFLYLEYITDDIVKTEIVSDLRYKIIDYLYKMIFEYSLIYFLLALFIKTKCFDNYCYLTYMKLNVLKSNIMFCSVIFWNVISYILLLISITFLSIESYVTNSFTYIKNKLDKVTTWNTLETRENDRIKFEMLSTIEDKSFFYRENSYSFMSIEFIIYKLNKIKTNINNISKSELTHRKILRKARKLTKYLFNNIKKIKNIKRYIRGYGTIEMQLIRTLGIKKGYDKVLYRKLYEIIYSRIFFASYRKFCNINKYRVKCSYKEYIIYCYIHLAGTKMNGKEFKNMLDPWKKKELEQITKEQFLISILGLSWRTIDIDILENYSSVIEQFDINETKLKKEIGKWQY